MKLIRTIASAAGVRISVTMAVVILIAGLSTPVVSSAQSREGIAGSVVDEETGDPLIGANVFIRGTLTGTSTDLEGRFWLEKLVPGLYTIETRFIGYQVLTIKNVDVVAGETTMLDISLTPEAVGLDEVFVEARMLKNNDATLLRERQRAPSVSDAISAEAIGRSSASTAADAMKTVTGASVVGGKYVYVRGLGGRYSSTHLNGIEMPSSDPDKNAFQFDLIPSALLDNIVTQKTFTPDKPGNFSGGLVNIGTKSYPDQMSARFTLSSSLNSQTNFNSSYLTYPGSATDWMGFDNGERAIPEILSATDVVVPSASSARRDTESAVALDSFSKSFNNIMSPVEGHAPVNSKFSMSLGNTVNVLGRKLGYIASLSYVRKAASYGDGNVGRYSYTGTILSPDLLLNDARSIDDVTWGGIANLTYTISPLHEIGVNSFYNRGGESMARFQIGSWPKELGQDDSTSFFLNRMLSYTERELVSFQVKGKHVFPSTLNSVVEWSVSTSSTRQDEPDTRFFASTDRTIGQNRVQSARSSGFADPARYYRELQENTNAYQLDVAIPFSRWFSGLSKLKLGGLYQDTGRSFRERIFTYDLNRPFLGDERAYFSDVNLGIVAVDTTRQRYTFGNVIRDASKERNNYDGIRSIAAGYAMLEIPVSSRFRLIGGARVESTRMDVASFDTTRIAGELDDLDVLPSINVVLEVANNMNLRAAWTRTLARPTFREIAPFESFDFILSNFRIGNPKLQITRITNYDLRWEWFKRPGEIIAFSLFHKRLQNAIEQVIVGGTNGQLQYQNVDRAIIYGAEAEFRTGLSFVPGPGFVAAGVNASLVSSEVSIAESELEVRQAIDPEASETRALQGQSPFILNADMTWTSRPGSTVVSLFFNVFGSRLASVSLGGTPDVYERPSPQLDVSVRRHFQRQWSMKITVSNVLKSSSQMTYRFENQDYRYSSFNPGRTFSLGISFEPY